MTGSHQQNMDRKSITLWLDPVCPFSWNTARWLRTAADKSGFNFELRLMSLAVLNEGRELPAPERARMTDSRIAGRLMAALHDESDTEEFKSAYFAFGQQYFDRPAPISEELAAHVIRTAGANRTTATVLTDSSWDTAVRESHEASQKALGGTGGSPILTIGGRTAFGPVFKGVPEDDQIVPVFDSVTALFNTPQFYELSRPRHH